MASEVPQPHLYLGVDVTPIGSVSEKDIDTAARTVYGEARGETFIGQVAVAWVIRRRVELSPKYGRGVTSVCMRPYAFSCWLPNDPNYRLLQAVSLPNVRYQRALGIVALVLGGEIEDPTNLATHYLNPLGVRELPGWAKSLPVVATIGQHTFYRET